jgi:hypothetical protein
VLTMVVVFIGYRFDVLECVVLTMILLEVIEPLFSGSSPSSMPFADADQEELMGRVGLKR